MIRNFTRIIIKNNIRIYLSDLTDTVNQILNYHNYLPLPSLILANAITSFSPLRFLYQSDNIMIRIKSNGAIGSLIFEIKDNSVRTLISKSNIETEYDDKKYNLIPLILGIGDQGIMEMTREVNNEFFTSQTKLVKSDIVTDLAYFLNKSDQIFSAIINDVELDEKNHTCALKAKNVIFQLLPDHSEEDKVWIEEFIKKYPLKEYSILDLEEFIDGKLLEIKQIDANCWCHKDRIINAIKLLKESEINEIFSKDKSVEVVCDFCRVKYEITKEEVLSNE